MIPTEQQECDKLVQYLRLRGIRFTHIANETGAGRDSRMQGRRNKRAGMAKGVPDYMIILPLGLFFIEMKRIKGSKVSQEQKDWIAALQDLDGVEARICYGADDAIKFIESYYPRSTSGFGDGLQF